MRRDDRPAAKARPGLADKLFVYGSTTTYIVLVLAAVLAIRLYVG